MKWSNNAVVVGGGGSGGMVVHGGGAIRDLLVEAQGPEEFRVNK